MKTKQNLFVILMVATMLSPVFSKAQSLAYRNPTSDSHTEKKAEWKPANLDDKESNVRNGVEFYMQNTKCNTKKVVTPEKAAFDPPHHHSVTPDMYVAEPVILVKLVNTNTHPMKVSYQTADFSPVVNILIPPSTAIEGACGTTDNNLAKLVITPPAGKTKEEKQKNSSYIKEHIMVSEIK